VIRIKGARTHNLKNIHLEIPRNRLIVITGLSGSGKSSLAFDTIFAEGQRRYVESLSAYARQFLTRIEKPDVDRIEGLSPAISIDQKATSHNPRSTVGTVTEIHDYLRLLYARAATPCCPQHGEPLEAETVGQMCDRLMALPENTRVMLLAPLVRGRKGEYARLLEHLRMQGYVRARIDGALCELDAAPALDLRRKHTIEVVVDRLKIRPGVELRVAESLEIALRLADGLALAAPMDGGGEEVLLSAKFACPHCGYTLSELEPRLFSFNNPAGACPECDGLGTVEYFDEDKIINPALSIAGGAVRGRDRRNRQYLETMQALAGHYRFDIEAPFGSLPEKVRSVILYGGGDEIVFHYRDSSDRRVRRRHPFTGVIAGMERRYEETASDKVREELRRYLSLQACPECGGERLNTAARHVVLQDVRLPEISAMTIADALAFFGRLKLPGVKAEIAGRIVEEIRRRLQFLVNVGLDYLSLGRSAETLSGGEAQRIRLASQIGSGLVGVMYILDEPSIGLHQRDNRRLLDTLTELRDLGNTVIVVEHDEEAVRSADHIIDIGPGAGEHGGRVVAQGTPRQIEKKSASLTGQYLAGRRRIEVPQQRTPANPKRRLVIRKASGNNLKNINVEIPLGLLVAVTGVSGSGKSTLVNETLYKHVARRLNGGAHLMEAPCEEIVGIEQIDKVIDVNQSPIGKTPRSNPATYTGLFTPIRELFAGTPEARSRGYAPGRFSFNVKGGRCEACGGGGLIRVEMHFLPDIYVTCDICRGKRYNRETLDIRYKGRNTAEVLDMTVEEARVFFDAVPAVRARLQTLMDVGLSYIKLGQNSTTLSGGEAQRVKLSRELSRRDTGRTLYILDEPTTGLHFHDIEQLLRVLCRLRDGGNTVVVIEHNLDVIKTADWIIDLGPEGGARGGRVVAAATPEDIVRRKASWTGRYLKKHL